MCRSTLGGMVSGPAASDRPDQRLDMSPPRPDCAGVRAATVCVAVTLSIAAINATGWTPRAIAATAGPPAVNRTESAPPCRVSAQLVPSCGVLWGVAAGAYSAVARERAVLRFEQRTGRTAAVYHAFHRADELFPTREQIDLARAPGGRRILFLNWKVAWGTTWAGVAAGGQDARIDRLAAHIVRSFPEPFFLAIHHEPEDDVNPYPDSGMTASDYAAMFAYTVRRLRANGVTNAVTVMAYMGNEKWPARLWWPQLYPGDDVVDWIALDSYVRAQPGYHHGDFADLLSRSPDLHQWPGYYTWATTTHPEKPFMLGEWGVIGDLAYSAEKVRIFDSVVAQLPRFPAVRAMVYFDGQIPRIGDSRPHTSPEALEAFKRIAAQPIFDVGVDASMIG
jgi:hypothetical protein